MKHYKSNDIGLNNLEESILSFIISRDTNLYYSTNYSCYKVSFDFITNKGEVIFINKDHLKGTYNIKPKTHFWTYFEGSNDSLNKLLDIISVNKTSNFLSEDLFRE